MKALLFILAISLQVQVDSLCNLAYDCEDRGDFAAAIRANQEALELTPADSLQWLSDISSNLTTEYFYIGDFEQAAHYGLQALKMDEQMGNAQNLSSSLNNLAAIYMQLNQLDKAIEMAQRAVATEEQMEPARPAVLAGRLGILSEALTKADRFEDALPFAQRAVALDRQTGNAYKLGIHLSQLGNIYVQQRAFDQAMPCLDEAVPLLRQTGNITSLVITLVPYAQALRGYRRYPQAENALKECVDWTWKTGQRQTRLTAYRELSTLYHQWDEYVAQTAGCSTKNDLGVLSHDYFEQFSLLKDSLYSEQLQHQIADMEVLYETEKKDLEIQRQQSVMKRQRMAIISIVSIVLVLLVLVFFIIIYARTQRRIAEEETRFISILSHDLKSPAVAQQRILRQLADGVAKVDKDLLQAVASAQDTQVELILNMLDYARLEAGRVSMEPIALDLSMVAEDTIALLNEQAKQKNITLKPATCNLPPATCNLQPATCNSPNGVQPLITDRTLVMTIMRNLVNNAIKFSPEGSEVTIEIGDHAFAVKDQGIGFGAPSSEKGTGLGLDICRRFAQMMHASIEIAPNEPKGSVIRVIFAKK